MPSEPTNDPELRDVQSTILHTTLEEISHRSDKQDPSKPPLDDCCVICLCEITESCEAQPCRHGNFDYLCLVTWAEQQDRCPLCKTSITSIRYAFSDDRASWKTYTLRREPAPSAPKDDDQSNLHRHPRRPYSNVERLRQRQWGATYRSRRSDARSDRQTSSTANRNDALARRRYVYQNDLYSLHVGSNRVSRYRDLTPQLFSTDAELISRARAFLRRELQVFEFLAPGFESVDGSGGGHGSAPVTRRGNNAEFLLEYIVAILKTVDMQGSMGQAEELIQEFLGRENTRLLLHELRAWLRSPYMTLENWDRAVQYPDVSRRRPCQRSRSSSPRNGGRRMDASANTSAPRVNSEEVIYPSVWRQGDGF